MRLLDRWSDTTQITTIRAVRTHSSFSIEQKLIISTAVREFLGIPYAKPPTGPLRFAPPVRKEKFAQPFTADQFGASCYNVNFQLPGLGGDSSPILLPPPTREDEDCVCMGSIISTDQAGNRGFSYLSISGLPASEGSLEPLAGMQSCCGSMVEVSPWGPARLLLTTAKISFVIRRVLLLFPSISTSVLFSHNMEADIHWTAG